jgi:hypothetical protein
VSFSQPLPLKENNPAETPDHEQKEFEADSGNMLTAAILLISVIAGAMMLVIMTLFIKMLDRSSKKPGVAS